MIRTTYHKNPHNNDADYDIDESSGIVSQPVVCGSGFFGILHHPQLKQISKNPNPQACRSLEKSSDRRWWIYITTKQQQMTSG
jgi:hypothetical protein